MKSDVHQGGFSPVQSFRLAFQQRLSEYRKRYGSLAEGFGVVWEKTMEEFPVADEEQGELYRELLSWARDTELFSVMRSRRFLETEPTRS